MTGFVSDPAGFVSGLVGDSWQQALAAGNGTMGALLHGAPGAEQLVISHERLFRPLHAPRPAPHTAAVLGDLRALLADGRPQAAADTVVRLGEAEGYADDLHWTDPLVPGCILSWSTPMSPIGDYRRAVRFDTGVAEVTRTDDGHPTRCRMFVSRTDNVVVVEWHTAHPTGLTGTLRLAGAHASPSDVTHTAEAHPTRLTHRLRFANTWPGAVTGATTVARVHVDGPPPAVDGDALRITGARTVLVLLRLDVHQSAPNTPVAPPAPNTQPAPNTPPDFEARPAPDASADFEALPAGFETLLAPHARVHGELFGRCRLDLGGGADADTPAEELLAAPGTPVRPALVEKAFDAGRHTIISSTGALPPTLQGVWAGTWAPAWSSDYTLNGNVQNGAVAALLTTATPELLLPLFDMVDAMVDDLRDNATRLFGARGILLPARCSTHGRANHFNPEYCHTFWTAGAGWLGRFYVDYWLHTRDDGFLRDRALPFLREAATFYADFVDVGGDGPTFSPSYSPENASPDTGSQACVDATMDLAVLRDLLSNLIRAERAAGTPESGWRHWRGLLGRLPGYRVTDDGALAEWLDPRTADNDGHRHSSHLYPLWYEDDPAFVDDQRLRDAAATSIARRMRWRAEPGNDEMAFGLVQLGTAAAHLGDAETAYQCVTWLVTLYWQPNMVSTHDIGTIFNVDASGGLPSLVSEMLVQSDEHRIALLPALPAAWPRGSVHGIGTRAGVLVRSLHWDTDTLTLTLDPHVSTTLTLDLPWPARTTHPLDTADPLHPRLTVHANTPLTLTLTLTR